MSKCKKSTGEDWYCCHNDPDCNCDTGKNAVKLGATQPVTATVIGSTSWPGYQSTTVTAGNIATSASTSTHSTYTVTTGTGTGTGAAAAITSSTPASASNSSSSSSSSSSSGSTTALAAGLGAGIGSAVVLIGIGVFFFVRRSKKNRANAAVGSYKQCPPSPSSPHNTSQFGTSMIHITPHPGNGYYATSVVNEKDGTKAFKTQELDGSGNRSGYASAQNHGYSYERPEILAEMDTPGTLRPLNDMRTQERAELA